MGNYSDIVKKIEKKTGSKFKKANLKEIELLEKLNLPAEIINFYKSFEPSECIANGNNVRLWPINDIKEENIEYVPGCYTSPLGFIVFATTICGDTYCFDIADNDSDPKIVLISHEIISEETTLKEINEIKKIVAENLYDFLCKFLNNEVDEECNY